MLFALLSFAFAQSDEPADAAAGEPADESTVDGQPSARPVKYRQVDEVTFERPLDVDGELVRPQGVLLSEIRHRGFAPFITLRTDFDDEMVRSTGEVR